MPYVYNGSKQDAEEIIDPLPPLVPHTPRPPAVKRYATEEERRAAKAETRRRWRERNRERHLAQQAAHDQKRRGKAA